MSDSTNVDGPALDVDWRATPALLNANSFFLNSGVSVLTRLPTSDIVDAHPEELDKSFMRAFLVWMSPLIKIARVGQIQIGDIWMSPRAMDVARNTDRLMRSWKKEQRAFHPYGDEVSSAALMDLFISTLHLAGSVSSS